MESGRPAFYAALGRRLVAIQSLDEEQGEELCKALLDQCFRLGPRSIDAAVFLSVLKLNLSGYVSQTEHSDYIKRIGDNRDLRLTLVPILEMFQNKEGMD